MKMTIVWLIKILLNLHGKCYIENNDKRGDY